MNAPPLVLALVGIVGLIGLLTALVSLVSRMLRKRNGRNGTPAVVVQLQDTVIRGIIAEAVETQRVDAERRHAEMMTLLREIRDVNATNFEIIRDRLHALSTPIMVLIEALKTRER